MKALRISIIAVILAGCAHSPEEWISLEDFSNLDPNTSFMPFAGTGGAIDHSDIGDCELPGGATLNEVIAEEEAPTKTTSTYATSIGRNILSMWGHSKIRSYCGSYMSTDHNGEKIRLSGRIILPADGEVSRIMVVSHFTMGANYEAPSKELPIESIFATRGLAVIEPDYIGYGLTANMIHPYLCADVTARNVVDMYLAALPFLEAIDCKPKYDDIFLLGFSQGGAVTMSVAHEFEFNHPEVNIRLVMAGGGPYDICATYDQLIENDFTDYPCAIPMIIQGLDFGMNLGLDYSYFFLPRMVENIDEWINSKKYTMANITTLIGSNYTSSILTPEARDKSGEGMTKLYKAMVDNSVVNEWPIESPLYLFHSIDDKVVPFVNAYNLAKEMEGYNVTYNFGHFGKHTNACVRFMFSCIDLLEKHGDI